MPQFVNERALCAKCAAWIAAVYVRIVSSCLLYIVISHDPVCCAMTNPLELYVLVYGQFVCTSSELEVKDGTSMEIPPLENKAINAFFRFSVQSLQPVSH